MHSIAILFLLIVTSALGGDSVLEMPSQDLLQFSRDAQGAYTFPWKPHSELRVDKSRLRLLGREAREKLVAVIGVSANWEQGFITKPVPLDLPMDIGLVFRSGKDDLVLFCATTYSIDALFHGKRGWSDLTPEAGVRLQKWEHQYAAQELAAKPRE